MRTIGDIYDKQLRSTRKEIRELCEERDRAMARGEDVRDVQKKIFQMGRRLRRTRF